MSTKSYRAVTGTIFGAMALLHLLRIIYGWSAQIGGWHMPLTVSWLAFIVAGYLAYSGLKK